MRELEIRIKNDICDKVGVVIDRVSCFIGKDKDIHVHGSISWETTGENLIGVKASLCNSKGQVLYELRNHSNIALDICGYNTFSMYCYNVSRFLDINQDLKARDAILLPQNSARSFTAISLRNMKECRHRDSRRKEQKRM